MKRSNYLVVIASFFYGILHELILGGFGTNPTFADILAISFAASISFAAIILIVPIFTSIFLTIKNKKFPEKTFNILSVIILVFMVIVLILAKIGEKYMQQ